MSFRRVQKLKLSGYIPVFESTEVVQKNGNIDYRLEDKADVALPSAELFDLTNLAEAGVALEEVNSKVMASKSVDAGAVVRKYVKSNIPNNGEKNNEK